MQTTPANKRARVDLFDHEFASLIESLRTLTKSVPPDSLYKPVASLTVGENVLKSAGVVEQTFGGITTNLWDDPFEWTLRETLSTPDLVLKYLSEVETTRQRAFASFADDQTLLKLIAVPSGSSRTLLELLLKTLTLASDYRGRAVATLKMLSGVSASGFII